MDKKVYIFAEKKDIDVIPLIGFTEDQIGEVAGAEAIIDHLIEQYILNIRFQGRDFDFINGQEYENAMAQVKHLQEFQAYAHDLVKKKHEYDLNLVIANAEKKSQAKLSKQNGDDMLE